MERITEKDLEILVGRINKVTNSPTATYRNVNVEHEKSILKANIDNYHLDWAYGGVKLVRIVSDGGGIEGISRNGFGTKRQLYNWMQAFLVGIATKTD